MDIGNVVSDSLRYPYSDLKKVVILGVLFLISFLIIPIFLAFGYMFRVIKSSLAGVEELPTFDEWGEMLVEGIKLTLVYLVYSLPIHNPRYFLIYLIMVIDMVSGIYYTGKWICSNSRYNIQYLRRNSHNWHGNCRNLLTGDLSNNGSSNWKHGLLQW